MRVTFFCFAKRKSPKKRRPPVCDPCASLRGRPASCRLRGAPWNSLCAGARRSDSHGESVHEAWALRRPCSPRNRPAAGAASRGGTAEQPTSIRAIAALGPVCAARGACAREMGPSEAKARVDVLAPLPLWMRRGAQGLADQGSRVSERRELSETSSNPSTAGCPVAKRRGRRQWGRLSFGYFSLAKQRKVPRMPGDSRPPPSTKACGHISARNQTLQNQ